MNVPVAFTNPMQQSIFDSEPWTELTLVPSILELTQNTRLLPSPKLRHSLVLCCVTGSQCSSVIHFNDSPFFGGPCRAPKSTWRPGIKCRTSHTFYFSLILNSIWWTCIWNSLSVISLRPHHIIFLYEHHIMLRIFWHVHQNFHYV